MAGMGQHDDKEDERSDDGRDLHDQADRLATFPTSPIHVGIGCEGVRPKILLSRSVTSSIGGSVGMRLCLIVSAPSTICWGRRRINQQQTHGRVPCVCTRPPDTDGAGQDNDALRCRASDLEDPRPQDSRSYNRESSQ